MDDSSEQHDSAPEITIEDPEVKRFDEPENLTRASRLSARAKKRMRKDNGIRCFAARADGSRCPELAEEGKKFCAIHAVKMLDLEEVPEDLTPEQEEIEKRRIQVMNLILVRKWHISQVSESLNVSRRTIEYDLQAIRKQGSEAIVRSLEVRDNVKAVLVEMIKAIEHRTHLLWREYTGITGAETVPVRTVRRRINRATGQVESEDITETTDPKSNTFAKMAVLRQIREEESQMLSVLEKFGLISSVIRAQIEGEVGLSIEAITSITRALAGVVNTQVESQEDRRKVLEAFDMLIASEGSKIMGLEE